MIYLSIFFIYRFFLFSIVPLGRATVMIRGIANRLGLPWGLCDRWALEAREALGKYGPCTYRTM